MTGRKAKPGIPLARLSAMVFRTLVDDLHERLAQRGFRDLSSSYGFVLLEARDRSLGVGFAEEFAWRQAVHFTPRTLPRVLTARPLPRFRARLGRSHGRCRRFRST